jgi:L-aminoadipate-semialdehyde dehydrogenase
MPLTPNGKIDKNALPFPDTALAAVSEESAASHLTATETMLRKIWGSILSIPCQSIIPSDSFFDIGGHSILATRMIFEIRQEIGLNVPLDLVYRQPTLKGMANGIEFLKSKDLNLAGQAILNSSEENIHSSVNSSRPETPAEILCKYDSEVDTLDDLSIVVDRLEYSFPSMSHPIFFLTGVTGFLGAFLLSSILNRYLGAKVYCLVRSQNEKEGLKRIKDNLVRHLLWKDDFSARFISICGDLSLAKFGLADNVWDELSKKVDIIIHNGALVFLYFNYKGTLGISI